MPGRVPAIDLHFPAQPAPDLLDRAALALDDLGVAAVHEIGSPEAPVWRVFVADGHAKDAEAALGTVLEPRGVRIILVSVENEDWAARSQADLCRVTVGRLIVAPPWDVPSHPDEAARTIVIRPSMGFGTGHHETTRLCLRLLQQVPLAGRRVLDLGTGSGVLAIAAARLGGGQVEAVDVDDDALAAARENLALNGVEDRVRLRAADLRSASIAPADVVIANLTGTLLARQAAGIAALVLPGGSFIASGLLTGETSMVLEAYAGRLSAPALVTQGEWAALQADAPA